MLSFLGEFDCKIDSKGRVMLPAALIRQIPSETDNKFVINRGFEECLNIYPETEWHKITEDIKKLNQYVKKNREFIRGLLNGATRVTLDSSNRLLIPRRLAELMKLKKEVVLVSHLNKIEIWNKNTYDEMISTDTGDFADLAEEVMGNINKDDTTDD